MTAISAPAPSRKQTKLRIEWVCAGRVNFASAQNNAAVIKSLSIANGTETTRSNIKVTLTSSPPVFKPKTWVIDQLAPDQDYALQDLNLPLDHIKLGGLNEAETGRITVSVETDAGIQAEISQDIDLLARDEWGGVADMAGILAAFVSPNDTAVAQLLKEASTLLEQSGQNASIEGYQSRDPQRVWMLAGAIWSAATGLGLSYAHPPASFETAGQKIRNPSRIKSEGLATCLDSTLLLAAAYEAAGLNPVVLFSQGHAWLALWLTDRDFGYVTEPDIVTVRKVIQAQECIAIETTLMTHRPAPGFEQAVKIGRSRLGEDREDEFVVAVDIARARAARIRPLASHCVAEMPETEQPAAAPAALPQPLILEAFPDDRDDVTPTTPLGRIERWQRKLLDLSLRNRLLNL